MLLELIAAAQSVDPTTLPLWAVVVLAAGMYPLGIMLGAPCSPCCNCGCPVGEQLPDAVAVSFAGLTKGVAKLDDLLSVKISACFGSGATATVAAPSGKVEAFVVEDAGPLSSVTLTSGGAGYAQIGRVAPVGLSVGGGSGSGAEFSVSVSPADPDNCGRPLWQIESVEVTKAGTGYVHEEELTVYLGTDEFEYLPAVLKLQTVAIEPTLSAAASHLTGTGAVFEVAIDQVQTSPNRWGVSEVKVLQPGEGYNGGGSVAFTVEDGTEVIPAAAIFFCVQAAPDLEVEVFGPGSGADFSIGLEQFESYGRDYWRVATLTPTAAGSGYTNGGGLRVKAQLGSFDELQSYWTIQTNGSGGIIGATKVSAGKFWKDTGVIDFVEIIEGGAYYKTSPDTDSVVVQAGGLFYKTDPTAPPLVANVTVEVVQTWPSQGSGEAITAEVDDDIESPTFGKIVALTLENGGDGFLSWAYELLSCCIQNWNGKTVIAKKSLSEPCVYEKDCCQFGTVRIKYNGQNEPPDAKIYNGCGVEFEVTTEPPYTCDAISFQGVDLFGTGTISVSPAQAGFDDDDYPCPGCCSVADKCTQAECLEALGVWRDPCRCDGCSGEAACETQYLVTVEAWWRSFYVENGEAVFFEIPGSRKSYDLNVNEDNGWNDDQTETINSGAYVVGARAYAVGCAVVVGASSEWVGGSGEYTFGSALTGVGGMTLNLPVVDRPDGLLCPIGGASGMTSTTNLISTSSLGLMEVTVTVVT